MTYRSSATREALSLYISGVGGVAFIDGLLPMIQMPPVIGLMFLAAWLLGALFFILVEVKRGRNIVWATLELGLLGVLCFGMVYGVMWYFLTYIPAHPSMMEFKLAVPTPSPTP